MSGTKATKPGWLARRLFGEALAGLQKRLHEQGAENLQLQEAISDLTTEAAALRETVALQALEIERRRIETSTLERRLDAETRERTTLGQALFAKIEGRGR